jgi:hypothetical protein
MRDMTAGHYLAAAVPVLAAGFGIYYLLCGAHPKGAHDPTSASVMKPSQYDREPAGVDREIASDDREPASADRKIALASDHDRPKGQRNREERDEISGKTAKHQRRQDATDDADDAPSGDRDSRGRRRPSSVLEGAANDAAAAGAECKPIEYRGDGPTATRVTRGEWTAVMDEFHGAKHAILALIEKRRAELPGGTADAMARQVRTLKIQRPPAADEPDLSWRGIGVYTQNSEGEPIVKVGGGFVHLEAKHPARARFEMTRLVAQSLAPCELKRLGAEELTWSPLLKCLGVREAAGCAQGSYSESGWAVSTTIAAAVAAPGCSISAFNTPDLARCMSHIPMSKTVAQSGAKNGTPEGTPSRGIASAPTETSGHDGNDETHSAGSQGEGK